MRNFQDLSMPTHFKILLAVVLLPSVRAAFGQAEGLAEEMSDTGSPDIEAFTAIVRAETFADQTRIAALEAHAAQLEARLKAVERGGGSIVPLPKDLVIPSSATAGGGDAVPVLTMHEKAQVESVGEGTRTYDWRQETNRLVLSHYYGEASGKPRLRWAPVQGIPASEPNTLESLFQYAYIHGFRVINLIGDSVMEGTFAAMHQSVGLGPYKR